MKNILFVFLSFLLCFSCKKEKKKEPISVADTFRLSEELSKKMELVRVEAKVVSNTLNFTGKVEAYENRQVKVAPLVDGIIESLRVELGDFVKKGASLAVIQSTDVADLENQSVAAKSDLLNAQKGLQVTKDLAKSGLAADKDVLIAQNELLKAQGAMKRAEDVSSIYGIKNSLYTVKAPIDGFVIQKNENISDKMAYRGVEIGAFFTIANLSEVQVIANVYESDISKIELNSPVEIKILSYPDQIFRGKIDKINKVIDPETRTMQVRINLLNHKNLLKPEMFAQISVQVKGGVVMTAIPSKAIIFDKSKNFVLVYRSKTDIEIKEVNVYRVDGGTAYVQAGLKEGERIIAYNQLLIYNALRE